MDEIGLIKYVITFSKWPILHRVSYQSIQFVPTNRDCGCGKWEYDAKYVVTTFSYWWITKIQSIVLKKRETIAIKVYGWEVYVENFHDTANKIISPTSRSGMDEITQRARDRRLHHCANSSSLSAVSSRTIWCLLLHLYHTASLQRRGYQVYWV